MSNPIETISDSSELVDDKEVAHGAALHFNAGEDYIREAEKAARERDSGKRELLEKVAAFENSLATPEEKENFEVMKGVKEKYPSLVWTVKEDTGEAVVVACAPSEGRAFNQGKGDTPIDIVAFTTKGPVGRSELIVGEDSSFSEIVNYRVFDRLSGILGERKIGWDIKPDHAPRMKMAKKTLEAHQANMEKTGDPLGRAELVSPSSADVLDML